MENRPPVQQMTLPNGKERAKKDAFYYSIIRKLEHQFKRPFPNFWSQTDVTSNSNNHGWFISAVVLIFFFSCREQEFKD
tara:strand:+ start:610 stop:846 length:237 start_codon:yes stop_codon:yes gene_type:complete